MINGNNIHLILKNYNGKITLTPKLNSTGNVQSRMILGHRE